MGFVFGQDWVCNVEFAPALDKETGETPRYELSATAQEGIMEELKPYFETIECDIVARNNMSMKYAETVRKLLEDFDGNYDSYIFVPSTSSSSFCCSRAQMSSWVRAMELRRLSTLLS